MDNQIKTKTTIQERWQKYIIELLTISLILGFICGVVAGFIKGRHYYIKNYFFLFLNTQIKNINYSVLIAFILLLMFLLLILGFHLKIKNIKIASFLATATISLPFFLLWGLRINQLYLPHRYELKSIIGNILVGLVFLLFWFVLSKILLSWINLRILNQNPARVKVLASLLAVFLLLNIVIPFSHNIYASTTLTPVYPNVIVLLIDALRADHLSCYGYTRNTTPCIDNFSKDAVTFTQAISQSTFTKTSVASLFTARYPYQHGVYAGTRRDSAGNLFGDILEDSETTLAEVLSANRFLTVAWIKNVHLSKAMGFSQGFVDYKLFTQGPPHPVGNIQHINKEFLNWAKKIGVKYPFFAYLHYIDLHHPYLPKPPYDKMYGYYTDVYSLIDYKKKGWNFYRNEIRAGNLKLPKKHVKQLISYYDGQLSYIDYQIGLLLDKLKSNNIYDNSIIIITSDHGDGFMEHGFISHSFIPYEELIRIPLIIKFPNSLYAKKIIKIPARSIDIMPTILDFLNIEMDSTLKGISLLNYLTDPISNETKDDRPEYILSEIASPNAYPTISIRTERYKYIHFENKKDELYDIRVDPKEEKNILDSYPNKAHDLRKIALRIVSERKVNNIEKVIVDKKTTDGLRTLGYIK